MAKWLVLAVFLLIINQVSASYIYGNIYLDDKGVAIFSVDSDVPLNYNGLVFDNSSLKGKSYEFTSKQGEVWTFNLNLGKYDDILVDVHLPKNLRSIKDISGVDNAINLDEKIISLIDKNKDLNFEVEYDLKESYNFIWLYFFILLIIVLGFISGIFFWIKKKKKFNSIFPLLNSNEEKIIKILMKGPMRQKEIRENLEVPKASFTRYVINLEKKKLIFREGEGKNKVLRVR